MLLLYRSKNEWTIFSEPVAPMASGGQRILEFAAKFLTDPAVKKICLETSEPIRRQILTLTPKNLKVRSVAYTLTWPIMNLVNFDPALPGKHYKSIRNAKNKFYREHAVEIVDATKLPAQELREIVDIWKKKRKHRDRAYCQEYYSLIDHGFRCAETARAMKMDDKIVGFNAGWKIINADDFYAAIGIHDYSVADLGLMLYLEDLEWLKKAGYHNIDMGGVEAGGALDFKKQFLPARYYKTFVFSIGRNKTQ